MINSLIDKNNIISKIESMILEYEKNDTSKEIDVEQLSPVDFEAYCAKVLQGSGWNASTTKGSGDQGIDVLAYKNGVRAVFQCKKYSSPIGNKAVQEAIAGKAFASADYAFVVTNSEYTASAKELAGKAGVHLFHYSQLSNIDRYIETNP